MAQVALSSVQQKVLRKYNKTIDALISRPLGELKAAKLLQLLEELKVVLQQYVSVSRNITLFIDVMPLISVIQRCTNEDWRAPEWLTVSLRFTTLLPVALAILQQQQDVSLESIVFGLALGFSSLAGDALSEFAHCFRQTLLPALHASAATVYAVVVQNALPVSMEFGPSALAIRKLFDYIVDSYAALHVDLLDALAFGDAAQRVNLARFLQAYWPIDSDFTSKSNVALPHAFSNERGARTLQHAVIRLLEDSEDLAVNELGMTLLFRRCIPSKDADKKEVGRLMLCVLQWMSSEIRVLDELVLQKRLRLESVWAVPWLERASSMFPELFLDALQPHPPSSIIYGSFFSELSDLPTEMEKINENRRAWRVNALRKLTKYEAFLRPVHNVLPHWFEELSSKLFGSVPPPVELLANGSAPRLHYEFAAAPNKSIRDGFREAVSAVMHAIRSRSVDDALQFPVLDVVLNQFRPLQPVSTQSLAEPAVLCKALLQKYQPSFRGLAWMRLLAQCSVRVGIDVWLQLFSSSWPVSHAVCLLECCVLQLSDGHLSTREIVRLLQTLAVLYTDSQRRNSFFEDAEQYRRFAELACDLFLFATGHTVEFHVAERTKVARPEDEGLLLPSKDNLTLLSDSPLDSFALRLLYLLDDEPDVAHVALRCLWTLLTHDNSVQRLDVFIEQNAELLVPRLWAVLDMAATNAFARVADMVLECLLRVFMVTSTLFEGVVRRTCESEQWAIRAASLTRTYHLLLACRDHKNAEHPALAVPVAFLFHALTDENVNVRQVAQVYMRALQPGHGELCSVLQSNLFGACMDRSLQKFVVKSALLAQQIFPALEAIQWAVLHQHLVPTLPANHPASKVAGGGTPALGRPAPVIEDADLLASYEVKALLVHLFFAGVAHASIDNGAECTRVLARVDALLDARDDDIFGSAAIQTAVLNGVGSCLELPSTFSESVIGFFLSAFLSNHETFRSEPSLHRWIELLFLVLEKHRLGDAEAMALPRVMEPVIAILQRDETPIPTRVLCLQVLELYATTYLAHGVQSLLSLLHIAVRIYHDMRSQQQLKVSSQALDLVRKLLRVYSEDGAIPCERTAIVQLCSQRLERLGVSNQSLFAVLDLCLSSRGAAPGLDLAAALVTLLTHVTNSLGALVADGSAAILLANAEALCTNIAHEPLPQAVFDVIPGLLRAFAKQHPDNVDVVAALLLLCNALLRNNQQCFYPLLKPVFGVAKAYMERHQLPAVAAARYATGIAACFPGDIHFAKFLADGIGHTSKLVQKVLTAPSMRARSDAAAAAASAATTGASGSSDGRDALLTQFVGFLVALHSDLDAVTDAAAQAERSCLSNFPEAYLQPLLRILSQPVVDLSYDSDASRQVAVLEAAAKAIVRQCCLQQALWRSVFLPVDAVKDATQLSSVMRSLTWIVMAARDSPKSAPVPDPKRFLEYVVASLGVLSPEKALSARKLHLLKVVCACTCALAYFTQRRLPDLGMRPQLAVFARIWGILRAFCAHPKKALPEPAVLYFVMKTAVFFFLLQPTFLVELEVDLTAFARHAELVTTQHQLPFAHRIAQLAAVVHRCAEQPPVTVSDRDLQEEIVQFVSLDEVDEGK